MFAPTIEPKPPDMRLSLLGLFLLICLAATAQKNKANPKSFATTITEADLKKHLTQVASKEMEGRETATAGQRKAAAYIENAFKAIGLQPGNQGSYQMLYPVYRDSIVTARMAVNGKDLALYTDFQPSATLSSSATLYFSEVVFVGYGLVDKGNYDSYGNADVAGKAVMFVAGSPEGYTAPQGRISPANIFGKIEAARAKGAAAIIYVTSTLRRTDGNMYTNLFKDALYPALYSVTDKAAEMLVGTGWNDWKEKIKKEKAEPVPVKVELQLELNKSVKKVESSNVLGVIEGTDKKDEYLVVTAHYDHLGKRGESVYYGADDDGSGTVSVIEIAEAFAKAKAAGKGPRRSILFMTVSGEEKGLWGSEYYSNHPTISPELITADLNIDMIGRVDTERKQKDTLNYVYVVGDDKLSSDLKPLSEGINKQYTKMTLDYKFNDPADKMRIYYRSDHYNFARIGVPIIFYYDGMLQADYHKPTDTIEKINFPLMAKRAQLVFYTAWEMANRDAMIKRDIPLPENVRR
jgi:hypothetical protein